jgi:hypothetical protein
VLAGLLPPGRGAGLGFSHAERLALGGDHDGVVEQAVEQCCSGGLLGQEPSPVLERVVRREPDGATFVAGSDEPEQQLAAGRVERGEPEFVDHEVVVAQQGVDGLADGVVGQAAVEGLDELGGGQVAGPVAGFDRGMAGGDEQVGLAGPGNPAILSLYSANLFNSR